MGWTQPSYDDSYDPVFWSARADASAAQPSTAITTQAAESTAPHRKAILRDSAFDWDPVSFSHSRMRGGVPGSAPCLRGGVIATTVQDDPQRARAPAKRRTTLRRLLLRVLKRGVCCGGSHGCRVLS
jgi:hypothetical protein